MNPGVHLPAEADYVVHRSDGSGHDLQLHQLSVQVSADWKSKFGEGTSVPWPAGIGGKGNEGVAAYVKQIKGSIGYVELPTRCRTDGATPRCRMPPAIGCSRMRRASRPPRPPPTGRNAKDFNLVMTNAPGADAWPITATNFILMYKQPKNAAFGEGPRVLQLGVGDGQSQARRSIMCRCRRRWCSRSGLHRGQCEIDLQTSV